MSAGQRVNILKVEETGTLKRVFGGTALPRLSVLAVMGTIAAGFNASG